MKFIIPVKKSRPVQFKDLFRVLKTGLEIKRAMTQPFPGRYPKAASISHCQIEETDPLRFFVVDRQFWWKFKARIIINPKILWTSRGGQRSNEACMSFPFENVKRMKRPEIVEMEYWTFYGKFKRKFYLFRAAMCLHEVDHMDGKNIYGLIPKKQK